MHDSRADSLRGGPLNRRRAAMRIRAPARGRHREGSRGAVVCAGLRPLPRPDSRDGGTGKVAMLDTSDPIQCNRYRIAYGEAARLLEASRFDHSYGRDFARRVEPERIRAEVAR